MNGLVSFDVGNVWTELSFRGNMRDNVAAALSRHLVADVPGAAFTWAFKSGEWDGKVQLYKTGNLGSDLCSFILRTGLVPTVLKALKVAGMEVEFGRDSRNLGTSNLLATQVPLRDYQFAAVKAMFSNSLTGFGWWPRGVLEIATGGGKTEVAVAMYEMNPVPSFFLVHRKDLLVQAQERFAKYGHKTGVLGAGQFSPVVSGINIATMQTIKSIVGGNIDSDKAKQLMPMIRDTRQVFFDECHLLSSNLDKGNEFTKIADLFSQATFRWGLTATPFMRTAYDNMLLEGVTGPSLYKISSQILIDAGWLTPPKVTMKKVVGQMPESFDFRSSRSNKARAEYWRTIEDKGIKFNEIRTNLIIDEIAKGPYPMLVLVKTIDQANFITGLRSASSKTNIPLPFLSGKSSIKDRRGAVEGLRNGSIPAIMATTIFDEGVDIPELRKVILASGGKSQVKLLQRIGRGLRPAAGKHEVVVIDFQDGHHSMLNKHAVERKKVWKEQGFEVKEEK